MSNLTELANAYAESYLDVQSAKAELIETPQCGKRYGGFTAARRARGRLFAAESRFLSAGRVASDWIDSQGGNDDALDLWREARNQAFWTTLGYVPDLTPKAEPDVLDMLREPEVEDDTRPIRPKGKPWNFKLPCGHKMNDHCEHYRDSV